MFRYCKRPVPPATIAPLGAPAGPAGEPANVDLRYRAVYSKRGKARYLSHIDLIHVIQRSFRRAGIEVRKTRGFHPKMDFTYGPALPLGMEALREVLEFRAARRLEAGEFLSRVNKSLPPGIRFSSLERIEGAAPSLHESMDKLVYSLDWKSDALGRAWSAGEVKLALGRLDQARAGAVSFRISGRRLYLELAPAPTKGLRAQDIVRAVFGAEDAVFIVRRDAVALKIDRAA